MKSVKIQNSGVSTGLGIGMARVTCGAGAATALAAGASGMLGIAAILIIIATIAGFACYGLEQI